MKGCTETGTLVLELLLCSKNNDVGHQLLHCLQQYVPGLHAEAALRIEHGRTEEDISLPLTLLSAIILSTVWKERESKTPIRPYKIQAELEQYITLLRTSRLGNAVVILNDMLHLMFD